MCGIVGISLCAHTPRSFATLEGIQKLFSELLLLAEIRGHEATGMLAINNSHTPLTAPAAKLFRTPLSAHEFIKTKEYLGIRSAVTNQTLSLLGHTRAATCGSPLNNKNNHPHLNGRVAGVHNGIIANHDSLWKLWEPLGVERRGQCDSEIIFALINHKLKTYPQQPDRAVAAAYADIRGSMAVAMVDLDRPHQTLLFRNMGSPLFYAWHQPSGAILFGSVASWFAQALAAAKLDAGGLGAPREVMPGELVVLDSLTTPAEFHQETRTKFPLVSAVTPYDESWAEGMIG